MKKGAAEIYDALRAEPGMTQEVFCGPRFTRLTHIRQLKETGALDEGLRWLSPALEPVGSRELA